MYLSSHSSPWLYTPWASLSQQFANNRASRSLDPYLDNWGKLTTGVYTWGDCLFCWGVKGYRGTLGECRWAGRAWWRGCKIKHFLNICPFAWLRIKNLTLSAYSLFMANLQPIWRKIRKHIVQLVRENSQNVENPRSIQYSSQLLAASRGVSILLLNPQ